MQSVVICLLVDKVEYLNIAAVLWTL